MKLFIDDERAPPDDVFVVLRSSSAAFEYIRAHGWPEFMSLDHDLGGDDTTMVLLRRLVDELWDGLTPPPDYHVHSANPVGRQNIIAFIESWKRVANANRYESFTTNREPQ